MHDIFRCHPNFHESPTDGARPWHDWAMVDYQHPATMDIVSVGARVLLWASLHTSQNPIHTEDNNEGEGETELYAVVNPLASYTRQADPYLPFGHTDRLSPNLEVIPFESIKGTAWVVPVNLKRTDPFPQEGRVTQSPLSELVPSDAFFVVPPRSTWQHLCWDHHLIRSHMTAAQDIFNNKIKLGKFDGPAPFQPLEEVMEDSYHSQESSLGNSREAQEEGEEGEEPDNSDESVETVSGSSGDEARGFTYTVGGNCKKRARVG